jgi:hypothetical protein
MWLIRHRANSNKNGRRLDDLKNVGCSIDRRSEPVPFQLDQGSFAPFCSAFFHVKGQSPRIKPEHVFAQERSGGNHLLTLRKVMQAVRRQIGRRLFDET